MLTYTSLDLPSLMKVARFLAVGLLCKGRSVALVGDLGVGKTAFCGEIVRCLSQEEFTGSPTFSIIHEYTCVGFQLYHIDLYRVTSLQEVFELGIFDVFYEAMMIIEWPEILLGSLSFDVTVVIKYSELRNDMRDIELLWKNGKLKSF